ncbi:phosphopantetheine-binding protein [Paenibacillus agilis]|uniref:Acyl carrier protein n=1 Tax=Paenibacillus agilis TaxID=3020863 RepID=A0A559J1X8_9BACL|nr:phosphopantetheine-binding protein [Paenibacillus agilis]TVX93856.1 acyl carrier protein [Paenibacillus agilis]
MNDKIIAILSEVKEDPALLQTLQPTSDIVNDAGLDSLQMINFMLAIEDEFDIQIDFDTFDYDHLSSIEIFSAFLRVSKAAQPQT